jgi:superoxide reductase
MCPFNTAGFAELCTAQWPFQPENQEEINTMAKVGELFQSADWKTEKHVPVIEVLTSSIKADEVFSVKLSLGKEVAHPNTTEHHIRWIQLFFKPEGDKFSYQVGNFEFAAHGESVEGANQGPVFTHHSVTTELKVKKSGMLYATALCNIHGLWENSLTIKV